MSLSRYPRYPAYKDSGVEWLGEVPAHWEVRRTDAILRYDKRQVEPSSLPSDEVFHYSIPIIHQTGDGQNEPVNSIDSAKLLITAERVLVSKLNPRKGMVLLARPHTLPTIASTEFVPFEPLDTDPRWATYLFLSESTRQRISATVRSATRSHQRAEVADVTKLWHAVPSKAEQENIANFLDRETARIGALIDKKRKLIELLQEQRAAIITRAVTRGLDPHAPMKDSGVEWLGEIPAHWEVKPLKRLFDNLDSRRIPLSSEERAGMQKTYPYYGASGIIDKVEDYLFEEPLILVAEDGANLRSRSTPLAFVAEGRYWVNNHAHILRPVDGIISFWAPLLASIEFEPWITGSAQPKLTSENLGSVLLPVPPRSERLQIATLLSQLARPLDELAQTIAAAMARLDELRSSLITAAVTGAIDVRTTSTGPGDADAA